MKIARHWTGLCKRDRAEDYIDHLRHETFIKLEQLKGFLRASILKRDIPEGIEFLIITEWESVEAIRTFAGDQYETVVVPSVAQEMMVRYDSKVRHYEINFTT